MFTNQYVVWLLLCGLAAAALGVFVARNNLEPVAPAITLAVVVAILTGVLRWRGII